MNEIECYIFCLWGLAFMPSGMQYIKEQFKQACEKYFPYRSKYPDQILIFHFDFIFKYWILILIWTNSNTSSYN